MWDARDLYGKMQGIRDKSKGRLGPAGVHPILSREDTVFLSACFKKTTFSPDVTRDHGSLGMSCRFSGPVANHAAATRGCRQRLPQYRLNTWGICASGMAGSFPSYFLIQAQEPQRHQRRGHFGANRSRSWPRRDPAPFFP